MIFPLLLFTLVFASVPSFAELRIVFTANRHGEVEPCGCQVNQVGGLDRFYNFLQENKQVTPSLLLDSGDTFFSAPRPNPARQDFEELRAKLIAKAYKKMGLNAFTPGERDFAFGKEFLLELRKISSANFVSANLADVQGKLIFEPFHLFTLAGKKIAVFGLQDEEAFRAISGVQVLSAEKAFKETVSAIKGHSPDLVVLLSHLGYPKDRELAQLGGADIILGSHSLDVIGEPTRVNNVLIGQPHFEGQQIGVIKVNFSDRTQGSYQLIELGKEFDKTNEVTRMMRELKNKVRSVALSSLPPDAPATIKTPYIGHPFVCRKCHQKQYSWWENSKHSGAYLVLYAKNQHFDPECVGCHTLGFESDGGFKDITKPILLGKPVHGQTSVESVMREVFSVDEKKGPLDSRVEPKRYRRLHKKYTQHILGLEKNGEVLQNFLGVQCEHCHGNRYNHPGGQAKKKPITQQICRACHKPPNAPVFDPALIKKIACPPIKKRKT